VRGFLRRPGLEQRWNGCPTSNDPMTTSIVDNVLDAQSQSAVFSFLNSPTWGFGWKSNAKVDVYSFWHKHFAGSRNPDHSAKASQYECTQELKQNAPLIHNVWLGLQASSLKGYLLRRCYANGQPYGSDGSIHTDSIEERSCTAIYYAHQKWHPNWGGETVLFNKEMTDVVAAIYPRPNRLAIFPGMTPHVARGVSRVCPILRITLLFKVELGPE
jgi:SM-20-related protein